MVNYTLGDSFGKVRDFEVRSGSGEVCIAGELDFETRSVYEFPIIATDRGKYITIFCQLCDSNSSYIYIYIYNYWMYSTGEK